MPKWWVQAALAIVAVLAVHGVMVGEAEANFTVSPVAILTFGDDGFAEMRDVSGVAITEIFGRTYAVIISWNDGVQIINMTDPAAPAPVATLSDGDDGFTELHGASGVAITEISGRTYAVVTAERDNGVQIINMTDPASPAPVVALSNGDNWFTGLERASGVAITEISGRTYAVVTSSDGVQIIDITNPAAPVPVTLSGDIWFAEPEGTSGVAITEISGRTYAVVTAGWDDVQIIDTTDPAAPVPVAPFWDIWITEPEGTSGVTIIEISGRTYAVVISHDDNVVQIIDMTDPASPAPVALSGDILLIGPEGTSGIATAEISGRTYAVITAERDSAQIIDMTDPAAPAPVAALSDGDDGFTELEGAYSVAITEISGRTYAAVTSFDGVQIINMTDPASPAPIAILSDRDDEFIKLRGASGVAIAEISGRTYAVISSDDDNVVQIIDITDPAAPAPVATLTDGDDGFTKLEGASGVAITEISGRTYAVVAAERDNGVQIINMTDPATPTPVATLTDGDDGFTKLRGASGVTITEISGRTYAVVTSWDDGVQIINMTDTAVPTPVGILSDVDNWFAEMGPNASVLVNMYRLYAEDDGFAEMDWQATTVAITEISGRTYAVANTHNGIAIIDMTPATPAQVATLTDGDNKILSVGGTSAVAITEISGRTYAVVTGKPDNSVQIIDMANLASPVPVASILHVYPPTSVVTLTDEINGFTMLNGARDVAITEISGRTYAVVTAERNDGVQIIDMTDPATPTPVAALFDGDHGSIELEEARDVAITEISGRTYAVVTSDGISSYGAVQIIDMTDPAAPAHVVALADEGNWFTGLQGASGVAIAEISGRTYAVVTAYDDNAVLIIDITDPAAPAPVAALFDGDDGFTVDSLFAAGWLWEARLYDKANEFTNLENAHDVAITEISGRTYAVVTSFDGVQIIDMTDPAFPSHVAALSDEHTAIFGADGVAITEISGRTYAVVTSFDGVQIIDMTDPAFPSHVAALSDEHTAIFGADGVAITEISGRTYAVVTSDGPWSAIDIINMTDPSAPALLPYILSTTSYTTTSQPIAP